jgi:hypothetical protein
MNTPKTNDTESSLASGQFPLTNDGNLVQGCQREPNMTDVVDDSPALVQTCSVSLSFAYSLFLVLYGCMVTRRAPVENLAG